MQNLVEVYKSATHQLQAVVSQTPLQLKKLHEVVSKADLEIQDLLHLAEFENFNAAQGCYITQQIKKARVRKRKAKEQIEELQSISKILNQNSKFEPHITAIQKSIATTKSTQEKRTYTPKVRSDLMERFNKCNHK